MAGHNEPPAAPRGAAFATVSRRDRSPIDARIVPDVGTILYRRLEDEGIQDLQVEFDSRFQIFWSFMRADRIPSVTPSLVRDIGRVQRAVRRVYAEQLDASARPVKYMVWASKLKGIWNLGGDLRLFAQLIRAQDRERLLAYAHEVVRVCYSNAVNLNLPLITIALVQGDALGGGFEGALSSNLLIAERSAKFGLPEILFNLFPGMGAYSFLARKIDAATAERMIFSGKIYSASELYDMGVVDVLAEDGRGEEALYSYINRHDGAHNTHTAIYRVRQRFNPVTFEEMADIATIWVDTALSLKEVDLRKMERLVVAQNRRLDRIAAGQADTVREEDAAG
jgi:DSF synthase